MPSPPDSPSRIPRPVYRAGVYAARAPHPADRTGSEDGTLGTRTPATRRQHQSNATTRRRAPRRGKNRVAQALRLAARSVGRTQTALGQFYRRIRGRIGPAGAITATAHKLARLVYAMLKYGREYVRTSLDASEQRMRSDQERSLRRKASVLGFALVPLPAVPDG